MDWPSLYPFAPGVEDRLRVLAAGFQQYVPKPVDGAELREAILAVSPGIGAAEDLA